MFKNFLVALSVVIAVAGCGKKDEAPANNQPQVGYNSIYNSQYGACPVAGQVRDQYGNCVVNNGQYGAACPVAGQVRDQYGNCVVNNGQYGAACPVAGQVRDQYGNCVAQTGGYPGSTYPQTNCPQNTVFVAQVNQCLPLYQGCPQGWGYYQATNLCYAPSNYNPYQGNTGGGFGFNWGFHFP